MVRIVVLGAGINGLACAVKIQDHYKDAEVVLLSHEFSPNTTGDGSGGLWRPYICGSTPQHLITKWGSVTFRLLHELWLQGGFNVCLIPVYYFNSKPTKAEKPEWADAVFGYERLNESQLDYFNKLYNSKYSSGARFTTFVAHPETLLKHFMERFQSKNGKVLTGQVTSLRDPLLSSYDVVVNCTGLGARDIVHDEAVIPVRGQIIKVTAPWLNQVTMDDDEGYYIIPNFETCVMGGTHQENDFNRNVDKKDAEFIVKGCGGLIPGLKHAAVVTQWTGLRPGRRAVRLEPERARGQLVVHNYGHGGSGFTLFWGCADTVLEILKEELKQDDLQKSKL